MSLRGYLRFVEPESLRECMEMMLDRIEALERQNEPEESGMAEDYKHKRAQAEAFRKVMAGEEE